MYLKNESAYSSTIQTQLPLISPSMFLQTLPRAWTLHTQTAYLKKKQKQKRVGPYLDTTWSFALLAVGIFPSSCVSKEVAPSTSSETLLPCPHDGTPLCLLTPWPPW